MIKDVEKLYRKCEKVSNQILKPLGCLMDCAEKGQLHTLKSRILFRINVSKIHKLYKYHTELQQAGEDIDLKSVLDLDDEQSDELVLKNISEEDAKYLMKGINIDKKSQDEQCMIKNSLEVIDMSIS